MGWKVQGQPDPWLMPSRVHGLLPSCLLTPLSVLWLQVHLRCLPVLLSFAWTPLKPADSQALLLPPFFGLSNTPFRHVSTAGARGLPTGSVKIIQALSGLLTFSVVPVKPVTCLYVRTIHINHEGDSRNPVWVWRKYFGLVGLFVSGLF